MSLFSFLDENFYFTHKKSFFSVPTSDNTASPNIGWTDAWAVPRLKFRRDRPPFPLGLRPWLRTVHFKTLNKQLSLICRWN